MNATDTVQPTTTERRTEAASDLHEARKLIRRAGKTVDPLTATERHNCTMALVTTTDALDAIVHAEATDRTLAELERAL